MKVSIIVPVYNAEKYIAQCIDSIIHQTYSNLEVLLIDDNSEDNSLNICKKYEKLDKRIKVIHKLNEGPAKTRNMGIKISTGDFILFIDSDDFIEKSMIELMVDTAIEKDVDVVRCNIKRYTDEVNFTAENMYELSNQKFTKNKIEKILYHFLTQKQNLGCYSVLLLMKKHVVLSFNTNYRFMEDYEYYTRLLLNINSIYFLDIPLYHYRYNEAGISKKSERAIKNIIDMTGVINQVETTLKEKMETNQKEILIKQIHTTYFVIFIGKIMICIKEDFRKGYKQLKEIIKVDTNKYLNDIDFTSLNMIKKIEYIMLKSHLYFLLCIFLKLILKVRR